MTDKEQSGNIPAEPEIPEELRRRREAAKERQKKKIRRQQMSILVGGAVFLVLFALALSIVRGRLNKVREQEVRQALVEQTKAQEADRLRSIEEHTLTMVAVGDNLIHDVIYNSVDNNQPYWNYDELYSALAEDISAADLAMVNQETVFADSHQGVSGYPNFATPQEIGDSLVNAGFDIVTHATNHACDWGVEGINISLDFWKKQHPEIRVLGIHESPEAAGELCIVEAKHMKLGFLNYTAMVNFNRQLEVPDYSLDLLGEEKLRADMKRLREAADVVIVSLHVGTEYSTEPDQEELDYLRILAEEGADVVLCSHPHVLQGFDTFVRADGREMLVYYSLGNFISAQKEPVRLLGGMARFTLFKDPATGVITITDKELVGLVTHYNYDQNLFKVYPLDQYTDELAAVHTIHQLSDAPFDVKTLRALYERALQDHWTL